MTYYRTYIVSSKGREAIEKFLFEHHKNLGFLADNTSTATEIVSHWVREVERNINEGNGAYLEVQAMYSNDRRTQIFRLSDDMLELREYDLED